MEKEREKNINVWLSLAHPLLGTWPTTQASALTGNQTSDPLVGRLALNPLSHTSQDTRFFLIGNNFPSKFLSYNSSVFWNFMICLNENLFSSIVLSTQWTLSNWVHIFQFWEISLNNWMVSLFVWFVFLNCFSGTLYYLEVGPLGLVLYSYFLSPIFHHCSFLFYFLDFFSTLFSNFPIAFSLFSTFKNSF